MRNRAGVTLVETLVVAVLLLLGIVLAVPAFARASRQERLERCIGNLKTLHQAQAAFYPGNPLHATERGKAYWTRLAAGPAPRVGPDALRCPLAADPAPSPCHYLGPSRDASTLAPDGVLGCDEPLNHSLNGKEGGNILRNSGQVVTDNAQLWHEARVACSASGP